MAVEEERGAGGGGLGCLKHGRLLRVTGRVPRVTGHVPRVTDHVPRVTDHVPRVTDHVPRARPRPRVDLGALAMSRGAPPPRTAPQSHVPMSRPRPYGSDPPPRRPWRDHRGAALCGVVRGGGGCGPGAGVPCSYVCIWGGAVGQRD